MFGVQPSKLRFWLESGPYGSYCIASLDTIYQHSRGENVGSLLHAKFVLLVLCCVVQCYKAIVKGGLQHPLTRILLYEYPPLRFGRLKLYTMLKSASRLKSCEYFFDSFSVACN